MSDRDFIKNLTRDLEPRAPLASPRVPFLGWLLGTSMFLAVALFLHKLRVDVIQIVERVSFNLEYLASFTVALLAAAGALQLRVPGAKAPLKALGFAVCLWLGSIVFHSYSIHPGPLSFEWRAALDCGAWIMAWGLPPGIALWFFVKKGATTEPRLALGLVAVAYAAMAAGFLTFGCGNDELMHLLLGHTMPVIPLVVAGWLAGRRLLRW